MNLDDAYLLDIFNAIQRIKLFTANLTQEQLRANEEKQSAILYQIIVVGEATKRLSTEFRTANSHIPWKAIAGMRDILAHQYDRVNFNTLWDVVQRDIIELEEMLSPLLPNVN
ncbi:DUF86 domain-containing protein [Picosynechococcus sp. NKBG15041c]|uniref:HepT-like ribonuclease domain-containing protein n=1 Tax=Picosynechococcus sp. NKBG15041c TaxID=1407650 RepID=UPI0003FABEB0|nr:DUF86 domain-containing protein [Picosynechococcus sp. NKBG15041c]